MCMALAGLGAAGGMGAGLSTIGSLFGTFTSFMGQMASSKAAAAQLAAQQQQAAYQAQVDRNNAQIEIWRADDAMKRGAEEERKHRLEVVQNKGEATAKYGAGNVVIGEGTPAGVIEDIAELGELDAQTIRSNAEREAWEYRMRANNYLAQAGLQDIAAGGSSTSPSTALGGSTTVSSTWNNY